jgi:hypothetical protein
MEAVGKNFRAMERWLAERGLTAAQALAAGDYPSSLELYLEADVRVAEDIAAWRRERFSATTRRQSAPEPSQGGDPEGLPGEEHE